MPVNYVNYREASRRENFPGEFQEIRESSPGEKFPSIFEDDALHFSIETLSKRVL